MALAQRMLSGTSCLPAGARKPPIRPGPRRRNVRAPARCVRARIRITRAPWTTRPTSGDGRPRDAIGRARGGNLDRRRGAVRSVAQSRAGAPLLDPQAELRAVGGERLRDAHLGVAQARVRALVVPRRRVVARAALGEAFPVHAALGGEPCGRRARACVHACVRARPKARVGAAAGVAWRRSAYCGCCTGPDPQPLSPKP